MISFKNKQEYSDTTMDAGARELVKKRVKPENARIILTLDDYIMRIDELKIPLKDCSRLIIEGRQFLETAREYIAAVSATARNGELEKLDYFKKTVYATVEKYLPQHVDRLTQEFPEIMNGHAQTIPSSQACQPAAESSLKS